MDFIERIFHVSPDGGNGVTELGLALAAIFIVVVIVLNRARWRFLERR